MSEIRFCSTAHQDFFLKNMMKCRVNDCYHRAFFYVMGIAAETRANINQMFDFKDFKNDCIVPEGMHGGWQTSGTVKVCHLAFNLWNNYVEEGREKSFTPEDLFCCEFAPYFMEGIKVRYPEYCRDLPTPKQRIDMLSDACLCEASHIIPMRPALREGDNVMDFPHRSQPTFLQAQLTQRMHRSIAVCPLPELMDRKKRDIMERKGDKEDENKRQKQQKRAAPPRYDEAFRAGAVRMVTEQGRPSKEVAQELGICIDTLRSWLKAAGVQMGQADRQNRNARRERELEAEVRALRKKLAEKDEVIELLKKIHRHNFQTVEDKYRYVKAASKKVCVGKLCQLLEISRSGYYAWLRGGKSARKTANQALLRELVRLHEKYPALGLDSLYHMLKPVFHCSRGRVHRLMKAAGIHSQRKRAYKATTNSRHNCPIAPNLLQRQFTFSRPNQAWVGDITYIPTGEGWLYLAIVKDLCTKKIVGYAFSQRIDTQLTLDALNMAVRRERPAPGLIFHSDRGVQYAAAAFRERLASLGVRQSMSRKGDPYDNAVAENFFSCLKCELVHLRRFDSRRAAQADLFTYIEAFYNTIRPHSSLGWLPPRDFEKRLLDWEAA